MNKATQFIFIFLSFVQSFAFLHANESSADNPSDCSHILRSGKGNPELKKIVTESDLVETFRKSSLLIYDSKAPRSLGMLRNGHMMSNEYDIFRLPQVLPQRDLFIGIGNNASWDLALRSGAHKIIFYDINYEPLILQRYFFRPLFEVAETPADFYKYLFLKVSKEHDKKNTLKLLEDFDFWEDHRWFDDEIVDLQSERQQLREELLQKIKDKSTDPEKEIVLDFVKKFQDTYYNSDLNLFPETRGSTYDDKGILNLFSSRYFPTKIQRYFSLSQKDMEALYEGNKTFLSSTENFQKMKKIMMEAEFVVASVESPFWEQLGQQSKYFSKGITIYTSNICDVYQDTLSSEKIKTQFLNAFKQSPVPVIHIETRGQKEEHSFQVEELK